MSFPECVLLLNAAATWFMCGVIWFVQLVHYPLFRAYARGDFGASMAKHQAQTGRVVVVPMAIEVITAVMLLVWPPAALPPWMMVSGAGLVLVWVLSTWLLQVPLHERLAAGGFDENIDRRLVHTNWLRTAAWSLRAGLCGVMLTYRG